MTIQIPDLDDARVLRHVELEGTGYTLLTWDTNRTDRHGKSILGYAFYEPGGTPLFVGEDFGSSPMHAVDSDDVLRSMIGFFTLKPGDTDDEYFESYTPEQMDFANSEAEQLSMWGMEDIEEPYAFKNLNDRDEYEENASPPPLPRHRRRPPSALEAARQMERQQPRRFDPSRPPSWRGSSRDVVVNPTSQRLPPQNTSVAAIILEQMGGRRMAMMIGAHSFVGSENSVSFRWKARGKDGINAIRIVLDPSDTYTVEFLSLRGNKRTVKHETSDVYAESLQPLFESKTGLALRL